MMLLGAFFAVSFLLTEPQAIPGGPPCPPSLPHPQHLLHQRPSRTSGTAWSLPAAAPAHHRAAPGPGLPPLPPANSQTGSPLGARLTCMGAGVLTMLAVAGPDREDVRTLRGADVSSGRAKKGDAPFKPSCSSTAPGQACKSRSFRRDAQRRSCLDASLWSISTG